MSKVTRILLVFALLLILLPVTNVIAESPNQLPTLPTNCTWLKLPSPAIGFACMPTDGVTWNGELLIYAHGFVPALVGEAPIIPQDQLVIKGMSVPEMVNALGYAFAVTSYSTNGLAIKDGVNDLVNLRNAFIKAFVKTRGRANLKVYVVGVSEGGLIATKAVEERPDLFSGGLACCGPVGDFKQQLDYFGNFRVVYDYFYPGVLYDHDPLYLDPQDAMHVAPTVIFDWASLTSVYKQMVIGGLLRGQSSAAQLINVTQAPIDPADPFNSTGATVISVLDYAVTATDDAVAKLGGIPFDNSNTTYVGSLDDGALNTGVARFTADTIAIQNIQTYYQTTGRLRRPLVTMHTTLDPVVPYFHEVIYQLKTIKSGSMWNHLNIPIVRYGHCNFTPAELIFGFNLVVFRATGRQPPLASNASESAEGVTFSLMN